MTAGKNEPPFENKFDYWCACKMLNLGGDRKIERKTRSVRRPPLPTAKLDMLPFGFSMAHIVPHS